MPSHAVQEILVRQERARIERLSRDAWRQHLTTDTPATSRVKGWRRTLGRRDTAGRA